MDGDRDVPARCAVVGGQAHDRVGSRGFELRSQDRRELGACTDLVVVELDEAESLDHGSMVASRYVGAMADVGSQREIPAISAESMPAARAPARSVSS